jgi:hypothetical protein
MMKKYSQKISFHFSGGEFTTLAACLKNNNVPKGLT